MGAQAERVVLVVEDDDLVRQYMVRVLADGGFRSLVAANGVDALARLSTLEAAVISAVVSDFVMPVMDGGQLAAAVAERWPTIPLLLVSGRPPTEWQGPFLAKPFTPPALVAAVEELSAPGVGAGR